jgi:hypothetical protein
MRGLAGSTTPAVCSPTASNSGRAAQRCGLGPSACGDDLVVPDPPVLQEMFLIRCYDGLLPAFTGESADRLHSSQIVTYRYSVEDASRAPHMLRYEP